MNNWITELSRVWTRSALSLIFAGITVSSGAGCSNSNNTTSQCTYQSSSNSGGICRVDLTCGDSDLAASCTDTDCVCIVNGANTGQRFAAKGFCGQTETSQSLLVEANCAITVSQAGAKTDASVSDPRCPPTAYTGMACSEKELGATCSGTAACSCTSGLINISTSCVCEEGTALGRTYRCKDDCKSACTHDAGMPDAGAPPDASTPDKGIAGSACSLPPQCIASTTGSTASIALIAKVCGEVGGSYVAACKTDHHDQCTASSQEVVIYTDKNIQPYSSADSEQACNSVGGVFTP